MNINLNATSVTLELTDNAKFIVCKDPDGTMAVCVCIGEEAIRVPLDQETAIILADHLDKLIA